MFNIMLPLPSPSCPSLPFPSFIAIIIAILIISFISVAIFIIIIIVIIIMSIIISDADESGDLDVEEFVRGIGVLRREDNGTHLLKMANELKSLKHAIKALPGAHR